MYPGPYLHSLEVSKLRNCRKSIQSDASTFGIDCVKTLLNVQEIAATYETETSRIKNAALRDLDQTADPEELNNADWLVIANATVVSMITGHEQHDVLRRRTLIVRNGVIVSSIHRADLSTLPRGAKVIDAEGGVVVPGFVDVHAHWAGADMSAVASSWEHRAFLAYGCTTVHK